MATALLLVLAAAAASEVHLVGTVVTPLPGRSVAILRSEGRTRVVAVGDTAFGARVVAVERQAATLDVGGETRRVGLLASAVAARLAPRPAPSPPAPGPPEDPATPARAMDKREVERRLTSEIPRILAETAAVPVLEDGRVAGLALTRIPEGSLLTDAGLRPGDVLTEVNDTRIDGMGTLMGLWPRLQNATELRAVVLRNGQPVSLAVTLR